MAGRFLLQKISSGASRSRSLLGAHASASVRAAASGVPRSSETAVKTLSNVFHGAAVHSGTGTVVPNNDGIHGCAARYLNTLACFSPAAKTGWSTAGMPSTISNHKKSALVNFAGSKQAFHLLHPTSTDIHGMLNWQFGKREVQLGLLKRGPTGRQMVPSNFRVLWRVCFFSLPFVWSLFLPMVAKVTTMAAKVTTMAQAVTMAAQAAANAWQWFKIVVWVKERSCKLREADFKKILVTLAT